MRILVPSKIQVGGHPYQIKLSKSIRAENGDNGDINHRTQLVRISTDVAASQQAQSLYHEILHAVNRIYCYGQIEERELDGAAEGLAQVLQQFGVELNWGSIEVEER